MSGRATTWTYSVIHRFYARGDGQGPGSGLVADASGALYGVTLGGGQFDNGRVYKLTRSGSTYRETALYDFKGGADGDVPSGTLLIGGRGAIFGTTEQGGSSYGGCGTVYRLTPNGTGYRKDTLFHFNCLSNGGTPYSGVIMDTHGALYGTTYEGGSQQYGLVFKLTPKGGTYTEEILHSFQGDNDGTSPIAAPVFGKDGALYGSTSLGGQFDKGLVYKIVRTASGYQESTVPSTHMRASKMERIPFVR